MDGSLPIETAPPTLAGSAPPPLRNRWSLAAPDKRQNPLPQIVAAAYEQPIVRITSPIGPYYVVGHADGVRHVMVDKVANYPKTAMENRLFGTAFGESLISSEGEAWRTHRRLMAPPLSPVSVATHAAGMVDETLAFQRQWDAASADKPVDVAHDMSRLALAIISRAMFSADGSALAPVVEQAISRGLDALRLGMGDFLPLVGDLRMRARRRRMATIFADLDAAVARMIAQREASGRQDDLLGRLIAARDGEAAGGAKLSPKEVRDEVVAIFLVGHETSAVALTWIWYLLSQHPAVEARLHAELAAALPGRAPAYEDLPALPYLRKVVQEALRFYPPAPGMSARTALADDEICGVKIRKGAIVICAPWITHRHRAHWDRPSVFDPDRFDEAASAGRAKLAHMPFGAGPRVCIGAAFAMTEIQLILATLAQRYRLRLPAGHVVELQHRITMRPAGGLPMLVERR